MDRREVIRIAVSTLTASGFIGMSAKLEAQQGGTVLGVSKLDQFESVVKNATSGLYILKNGEQDYSVKIVSGDGKKNVTIVRYEGLTAEADAQLVHTLFRSMLLVLRLDV